MPGWQALHEELSPLGLTVVTVALDVEPRHTYSWIDAASPTHPSLIDTGHVTDDLFGFVNIPMAVWIDETGTIVRPAEGASIERSPLRDMEIPDGLPRALGDVVLCPQVVGDRWRGPLTHGLLHLLGYDHGAEMEAREAVHE